MMVIGQTIGQGATSKVKLVQDQTGAQYALKVYRENSGLEHCIDEEVETLATINHPHIINIIEYGEGMKDCKKTG